MFKKIKEFFSERKIKKFSYTNTDASQGSDIKRLLSPEVNAVITKIRNSENISNEELNLLSSFYFNSPKVPAGLFTLNKAMTDGMVFNINKINTVYNQDNDIENIYISMDDVVFGESISMIVSVKEFHEFFVPLQPSELGKENVN